MCFVLGEVTFAWSGNRTQSSERKHCMDSESLNKRGYIEGIRGVYAGYIIELEQGEQLVHMSTEKSVNRSLKIRSLLT